MKKSYRYDFSVCFREREIEGGKYMELFLSLFDFIIGSESGVVSLAVCCVGVSIIIGVASYQKKIVYYVFHGRNRGGFMFFFLFASAVLFLSKYSDLPLSCLVFLLVGDLIYGIFCIIMIKKPVGYAAYILKKYYRDLKLGLVAENLSFFEKSHWYINEITEKIDYAKLKAKYYDSVGEKKEALNCISDIPEDWLYEEEILEFNMMKAMMLWGMGSFSTACELVSDEKYNEEPMV